MGFWLVSGIGTVILAVVLAVVVVAVLWAESHPGRRPR
jgi:hypothetical protein